MMLSKRPGRDREPITNPLLSEVISGKGLQHLYQQMLANNMIAITRFKQHDNMSFHNLLNLRTLAYWIKTKESAESRTEK